MSRGMKGPNHCQPAAASAPPPTGRSTFATCCNWLIAVLAVAVFLGTLIAFVIYRDGKIGEITVLNSRIAEYKAEENKYRDTLRLEKELEISSLRHNLSEETGKKTAHLTGNLETSFRCYRVLRSLAYVLFKESSRLQAEKSGSTLEKIFNVFTNLGMGGSTARESNLDVRDYQECEKSMDIIQFELQVSGSALAGFDPSPYVRKLLTAREQARKQGLAADSTEAYIAIAAATRDEVANQQPQLTTDAQGEQPGTKDAAMTTESKHTDIHDNGAELGEVEQNEEEEEDEKDKGDTEPIIKGTKPRQGRGSCSSPRWNSYMPWLSLGWQLPSLNGSCCDGVETYSVRP